MTMPTDERSSPADTPINLRCPACGQIRTPIINSYFLDKGEIPVLCFECYRRYQAAQPREDMFVEEKPVRQNWRFDMFDHGPVILPPKR